MTLAENLAHIRNRLARAARDAGRAPEEITLVGVSKTFPGAVLEEAIQAGLTDLGENRVQEARKKLPEVEGIDGVRCHYIGPIQTNKIKYYPALFQWVQTVSRPGELDELEKRYEQAGSTVKVLLQVNVGGEAQKNGIDPEDLPALLRAAEGRSHVQPRGLMTIPPYHEDPEDERPYYTHLRRLRDRALEEGHPWCRELSMGMSHDFEVAIAEGATIVRVGTAIFGERG